VLFEKIAQQWQGNRLLTFCSFIQSDIEMFIADATLFDTTRKTFNDRFLSSAESRGGWALYMQRLLQKSNGRRLFDRVRPLEVDHSRIADPFLKGGHSA
jgi:hypothetical protein